MKDVKDRTWTPLWLLVFFGFIAGCVLGYCALWAEVGCYPSNRTGFAHMAFPLAGWISHLKQAPNLPPAFLLALAQFPLYGAGIGSAYKKWKWGVWIALACIIVVHVAIYIASVEYFKLP